MDFLYDLCIAPCCLHRTLNEVREEVNKLQKENDRLTTENDKLGQTVQQLKGVEEQLQELSILQGKNVDELTKQVREFKVIQEQIKESLEAKVMQNLISVVMSADNDRDFKIDPEEVDGLKMRLNTIDGVDFSEQNFDKALKKAGYDPEAVKKHKEGYNITAVLEVMKNLFDDDVPEEDNIFTIKPEKLMEKK